MVFDVRLGLAFAEQGIGLVVRDAVEPGGEARRIVELAEVLIGFQKNVLCQVQSVFPVAGDAQQVIIDALLPPGDEEVIALHAAPGCLPDQVGIFNRPKNQFSGSLSQDAPRRAKSRCACWGRGSSSVAGTRREPRMNADKRR